MHRHLSRRRSPTVQPEEAHRGPAQAQIRRRHPDPAPPPVFTDAARAIAGAPPPRPRRPAPVSSSAPAAAYPAPPAAGLVSTPPWAGDRLDPGSRRPDPFRPSPAPRPRRPPSSPSAAGVPRLGLVGRIIVHYKSDLYGGCGVYASNILHRRSPMLCC
nr:atherin-like [Aegilops tauschii subsp. strangulata]